MADELDEIIRETLHDGLDRVGASMILRRLDIELQQQVEASAASGQPQPAWVVGGTAAGGFGSMAQRFITFYAAAIRRELCDAEARGLKRQYSELLHGQSLADQIKQLAPPLLASFDDSAVLVIPTTVAAIVALWLLRVGLEQWCAEDD
jgi:hypothetical protein